LYLRELEPDDEILDRRKRPRRTLCQDRSDTLTNSSIYRARHGQSDIDPALDDQCDKLMDKQSPDSTEVHPVESEGEEDQTRQASGGVERTPYRTAESSLNTRPAPIKKIEDALLEASNGRLNTDKMLDLRFKETPLDPTRKERLERICKGIVKEMVDDEAPIGEFVRTIRTRQSGPNGEANLCRAFSNFANSISAKIRKDDPEAISTDEQPIPGLFAYVGDKHMRAADLPGDGRPERPHRPNSSQKKGLSNRKTGDKIDILIHGHTADKDEHMRWDKILTFGEAKVEVGDDIRDSLLGQMLRYLVSRSVHPSVPFPCGY
jgi:hypothetical protein